MDVRVKILFTTTPTEKHKADMFDVASALTNERRSVTVFSLPDESQVIVAEFTIKKARQSDVVDIIGKAFSHGVDDYNDCTIAFPKRR